MAMAHQFLKSFDIKFQVCADKRTKRMERNEANGTNERTNERCVLQLRINSLGDASTRAAYAGVLNAYLERHADHLSPVSRDRLAAGRALRVLDSSEPVSAPPLASRRRSSVGAERH